MLIAFFGDLGLTGFNVLSTYGEVAKSFHTGICFCVCVGGCVCVSAEDCEIVRRGQRLGM